jgi:hypothetical protein
MGLSPVGATIKYRKMKLEELYEHIVKNMSPEEALKKLLSSSLRNYEKLKFKEGEEIHPEILITMAAMDLGWNIAVESKQETVRGFVVGTEDYIQEIFKKP